MKKKLLGAAEQNYSALVLFLFVIEVIIVARVRKGQMTAVSHRHPLNRTTVTWLAPPAGSRQRDELLMSKSLRCLSICQLSCSRTPAMKKEEEGEVLNYAPLLADIIGKQISPSDARHAVAKKTHGDQTQAGGGREKEREGRVGSGKTDSGD